MSTLCPHHLEQWMEALDARTTWRPAMVQIGGQSEANLIRHAESSRKARFERWKATVLHHQALAVAACARGINCTVTETFQPALFEVAA